MISPISQYSQISNNASKKNNNKVSFGGITRIQVVPPRDVYLSFREMGSVIDKLRNILLERKHPQTDEIRSAYSAIKRAFHTLDTDYFMPEQRAGVMNSVFARIRTGKNFFLLSGKEAQEHYNAGFQIGLTNKFGNRMGNNEDARKNAIVLKEAFAKSHQIGSKKPTVTVHVDDSFDIRKVVMTTDEPPFHSVVGIPKVSKNTQNQPTLLKNPPTPPKNPPTQPTQMTFDF